MAEAADEELRRDRFMAMGRRSDGSGVLPTKEIEPLNVAFEASLTAQDAPGTRRHIHNALRAGATMEEIFEVLKL